GRLRTPYVRCNPPGVTRRVILELCRKHGIPAEEADLTRDEVREADEIFLMGTMSGPVGAVELDGEPVGSGHVGEVTRRLYAYYNQALVDPDQGFDIFADIGSTSDQGSTPTR
ncbi:MAG: aminotransferase class IV, partial [Verrucomicrobiota bacterium]